ncbi:hypothetical protein Poli38472_005651 [Pythium oligandrum]|uniref:Uncharacterized protein n=1 Tax=Pythium oligandrum TaxID=41045 RepID=A0A8K1CHE5_PYTOL|nr:hypothetical protein Poli38472_005651 [Pythium oligandrum]|eukprot:TMW63033.1 hypothetical protein Poli38472_005651 [Pythium oligandrum]
MVLAYLRQLGAAHERLKKRIHSFRIPLSKNGQRAMSVVYFSVPVIGGYFVMKWAERRADRNFQLEEDKIRNATGASTTKSVQRQNEQLRRMLEHAKKE